MLFRSGYTTADPSEVVGYRLPTEAEWEYAARGGRHCSPHKYSGSDIVDEVAWYWDNLDGITYEVGQKQPNALGIYDMSGNVWEWCSDWWDSNNYSEGPATNPYNSTDGSGRVRRGGSWDNGAAHVRVAFRNYYSPTSTNDNRLGFRICRTVF